MMLIEPIGKTGYAQIAKVTLYGVVTCDLAPNRLSGASADFGSFVSVALKPTWRNKRDRQ